MNAILQRTTFSTSRLLEFFSAKELQTQIGFGPEWWPIALTKELIDNALDACETAAIAPEIAVTVNNDSVLVQDNGPGLPTETLIRSLDYTVRVSDKSHYVSPTRGQLGNALKCVYAAPFVADGEHGCVDIVTGGEAHRLDVALDRIEQRPDLRHTVSSDGFVKTGTLVKMHWRGIAGLLEPDHYPHSYNPLLNAATLVRRYLAFNPHAAFCYTGRVEDFNAEATNVRWYKWKPSNPTSPHWYDTEKLASLIAAYIADERNGGRARTVRAFVSEFKGLTGTRKQKQVVELAGLSGAYLHDLGAHGDIDRAQVSALLAAMQSESRQVRGQALGMIGQEHLTHFLTGIGYVAGDSVQYAKGVGVAQGGLPYVVEVAFGVNVHDECGREVIVGLNWAPVLKIPFNEVHHLLSDNFVDSSDPVVIVMHLACPRLDFTDRGKSTLALPDEILKTVERAIGTVTKTWKAMKRQMKRDAQIQQRELEQARQALRQRRLSIKEAAYRVMERAYLKASANNRYPANVRQIMYAARPCVLTLTGGRVWKKSSYFTQKLLPRFVEENPDLTASWDVVYDARGRLIEPHTGYRVDLGTLEVRRYIEGWTDIIASQEYSVSQLVDTKGPANRYRYALFVEKEGFNELFSAARIAARYDLAIMSTKGMSVTAARQLVDRLSQQGVTVLVIRDFDKAGFSIVDTLRSDTRRYRYAVPPNVVDLGLKLEDVRSMGLESEPVSYRSKKNPRENLHDCGASPEECNFLVSGGYPGRWRGERVELNAMTSDQLVTWLEHKLEEAGAAKVVPDEDTIRKAYRRAMYLYAVQQAIDEATAEYQENDDVTIPAGLRERIQETIRDSATSWDMALWQLTAERLDPDRDPRRPRRNLTLEDE